MIEPGSTQYPDEIYTPYGQGGVAVSPTGYVYVSGGSDYLWEVDPATNDIVNTFTLSPDAVGMGPVAVSPAGPAAGYVYVANYLSNTVSIIQP